MSNSTWNLYLTSCGGVGLRPPPPQLYLSPVFLHILVPISVLVYKLIVSLISNLTDSIDLTELTKLTKLTELTELTKLTKLMHLSNLFDFGNFSYPNGLVAFICSMVASLGEVPT